MMNYLLNGKTPVPEPDIIKWAMGIAGVDRVVKQENVGDSRISTVFLGLDHRMPNESEPVLFETMVFGGDNDGYQERYSTWEQAEKGHNKIVEKVRQNKPL